MKDKTRELAITDPVLLSKTDDIAIFRFAIDIIRARCCGVDYSLRCDWPAGVPTFSENISGLS